MAFLKLLVIIFIGLFSVPLSGQYKWHARDPVDLNYLDFGDNKLLLYNGIGVGLSAILSKKGDADHDAYKKHYLGIQYFREYLRAPLSELVSINYRRRWNLRKFLFIGAEARAYHVRDIDVETQGLGFSLAFEWHLIRRPNFRLIYDNGVGPNVFLDPFPEGGTRFNFSTNYGIRIDQRINTQWWSIGLYNLHISNAEIKGRERNPALDAVGISVGLYLD